MQNPKLSELADKAKAAYLELAVALQLRGSKHLRQIGDDMEKQAEAFSAMRDYLKTREIITESDEPALVDLLKLK